jgi:predicted PurR-regulated permease PerM
MIGRFISNLGSVLANTLLILLILVFFLLETLYFPKKLRSILKDPERSLEKFRGFIKDLQKYLAIKTIVSATDGLIIGVGLTIVGVDYAVLWGLLAFLFNFVPNIGSIIAAIPPILVAFIQLGLMEAVAVTLIFGGINLIVGNLIEPRVMGQGVGLSTLIVFVSLVFWGWVFGPIGILLSVPLTMTVKLALASSEGTKWLAVLMGPDMTDKQLNHAERVEV